MKCPLMLKTWESKPNVITFEPMNCIKEQCAWWDEGLQACSVYKIQEQLGLVFDTLREMVDKMPSEEQFRK